MCYKLLYIYVTKFLKKGHQSRKTILIPIAHHSTTLYRKCGIPEKSLLSFLDTEFIDFL